jgi:YesN/AraC family two-component response regulator
LQEPIGSMNFRIQGIGIQETLPPKMVNRPLGFASYLFMFFYDEVRILLDGKLQNSPGFRLMIWKPGDRHYYGNMEKPWNHTWILCKGKFVQRQLEECRMPVGKLLSMPDSSVMENTFAEIYLELSRSDYDIVIAQNLFHIWLREVARIVNRKQNRRQIPEKYQNIRSLIEREYYKPIRLADIAEAFSLSIPHLASQFKRYFGYSVVSYLIHERLQHAVYMLHDKSFSVREIAQSVGYDDIYYFSRLFKKYYKMSPTKLRKQWLLNGT